jgi:hypothetical protein
MIYKINFNDFIDTPNLLKNLKQQKYWLYAHPKVSTTLTETEVKQRIKIESNGCCNLLKLILYKTDKDYANKGLNPRTELRLPIMLPSSMTITVFITCQINVGIAAEFLQVMGRITRSGSARPLVQLEVRDSKFCVRYSKQDGSLWSKPLGPVPTGMNDFRVEYKIKDFLKVSLNDKVVFEFDTRIELGDTNIQYGLYRNKNIQKDQEILIKGLSISY